MQELRAKRTLDRLSVLTAPKAHVVRDGQVQEVPVDRVVLDDVLELAPGMQVVVDGDVLASDGLELDESLLTGESESVEKRPGDEAMSGSFVAAGAGRMVATAVGADAYAVKLALEAKRFALTRSELRDGVDQILRWVTIAIVPTAALLFVSQLRHHDSWHIAVRGAVAGTVAMVPEGLVLLMSLAFAVAVLRLAKRNVLVQELPAVEGLARVDVLCIDKTGTLTAGKLSVVAVEPLDGGPSVDEALAAIAAADEHPNATMTAIGDRFPTAPSGWSSTASVPFSSARKWSAVSFGEHGSWFVGGADVLIGAGDAASGRVADAAGEGSRVLVLARADGLPQNGELPPSLRPAALVMLKDTVRPDAAATLAYFREQEVTVKVISGDDPRTVGAIALELGLEGADRPVDARDLPDDEAALAEAVEASSVFGRVTPQQKQAMVNALAIEGTHRRHDRRRRERRARVEGRGHRHRDGLGERRHACRRATRAPGLELRRAPAGGRRRTPRARQHRTHVRPLHHEDRLRDVAVARGRRGRVPVPVPAAAPDADRRAHDRHPVVLPGARAEHRPVPAGVRPAGARASRSPPGRSRRSRRSSRTRWCATSPA